MKIADTFIKLLKYAPRPVVLHEPSFTGKEWEYVKDCIETGWVSSVGSYVDRFEEDLGKFVGAHAISTVNGTAALHLALGLADVEAGDEVLVPNLTFVATANAVSYCHATPHFVEAERETFGVDPEKLEAYLKTLSKKPKALIVTHIFGHPASLNALKMVCDTHGIIMIEDAAESLGSYYNDQHTGTFGHVAALSFNGNKIMTTGGGGAVITTDAELAGRAKHLSTTAKVPDPYTHIHDEVGYNYRMPNINAALGCAQLESLPEFLEQKQQLAQKYKEVVSEFSDIEFVDKAAGTVSNYWLNNIILPSEQERNDFIDALAKKKIFCRGLWAPMSALPMYKDNPQMPTPVTEELCKRTVSLPSSPLLSRYI